MIENTMRLLVHQAKLIRSIHSHPNIDYFFLTGGFGCGKSFTVVSLIMAILHWYQGEYLTFGIGGAAIKHLRETVIKDVVSLFERCSIKYRHNSQEGLISVGTITFVYFSLDRPDTIFGHNLSACIADEGGELQEKGRFKESVVAITERLRVPLPSTLTQPVAREPFFVSTTTAQGLDGVWLFRNFLTNVAKIPYVDIRAKTSDNYNLSKKQLDNLYALYTPDEARVYLEGEYLNLTTGRVYAEFDSTRNVYGGFHITEDDTLYCGQDFNTGYNACVVVIKRGERLYVVDIHHWDVVGDAPRRLRHLYPDNRIVFIPDASGKEIMGGWMDEFDAYDVELCWNSVNPPISERILVVNKLFRTGGMMVFKRCSKLLDCLNLRGFDDTGKPVKEKGKDGLDHWGDALEYAAWHIVHHVGGFERILECIGRRLVA